MKHYAFCRSDGVVQFTSQLQDDVTPEAPAGLTLVPIEGPLIGGPHRVVNGAPEPFTEEPSLDDIKAAKKADIEREREARNQLPIVFNGALFDADATAQRNVGAWQTQLANGKTLPDGFRWRDYANEYHPADAAFVNGLGEAITLRGTELYQQMWALKAQVDAATTAAEVEAVVWPD